VIYDKINKNIKMGRCKESRKNITGFEFIIILVIGSWLTGCGGSGSKETPAVSDTLGKAEFLTSYEQELGYACQRDVPFNGLILDALCLTPKSALITANVDGTNQLNFGVIYDGVLTAGQQASVDEINASMMPVNASAISEIFQYGPMTLAGVGTAVANIQTSVFPAVLTSRINVGVTYDPKGFDGGTDFQITGTPYTENTYEVSTDGGLYVFPATCDVIDKSNSDAIVTVNLTSNGNGSATFSSIFDFYALTDNLNEATRTVDVANPIICNGIEIGKSAFNNGAF
jgi:hypothetical protein